MPAHIDPLLLTFGLARIAVWTVIAAVGYHQRRILPLTFGTAAALTSIVFAIHNAHGHIPGALTDASTFIALPIAALILGGVMVTRPTTSIGRGKWGL